MRFCRASRPGEIDEAVDLIRRYTRSTGHDHRAWSSTSCAFVTPRCCDRIVVLDQGRVLAQGSAAGGDGTPAMSAIAYLGTRTCLRCATLRVDYGAAAPRCGMSRSRSAAGRARVACLGPNGAGKTTLINAIARGLHPVKSGAMEMAGPPDPPSRASPSHRFCAAGHRDRTRGDGASFSAMDGAREPRARQATLPPRPKPSGCAHLDLRLHALPPRVRDTLGPRPAGLALRRPATDGGRSAVH